MTEDPIEEPDEIPGPEESLPDEDTQGRARVRREGYGLAGRLLRAGVDAMAETSERLRERGEDFAPREVLNSAVNLTARGKEEVMTLVAKEVRGYLSKLQVAEELERFLTTHSLDISASIRLKPVAAPEQPEDDEQPGGDVAEDDEA